MVGEELDFLDGRGKIKFLEDRIEFYCKLEQSFGHADEYLNDKIPYSSIPTLPIEPEEETFKNFYQFKKFIFHVPKITRTIVFFLTREYDSDASPNCDESLDGPYLLKESSN